MNKYYYEEIPKEELQSPNSPLKYHIFEKTGVIQDDEEQSKLMAWCYEEEFAKKLVNTLNEASNPVSAFANKIANLITEHDENTHKYGRKLQAKILNFSNILTKHSNITSLEINIIKKNFDEYFDIEVQKDNKI